MPSLLDRTKAPSPPLERLEFGPWQGSMRRCTRDLVPPTHENGGSNFIYVPRTGRFRRRKGQSMKFDTFGSAVGLLPAQWTDAAAPLNAKARWGEEFLSDSISDGVPTTAWLITKEAFVTAGVDDGRFSTLYIRDQVNNANYTLGSEYGSTTYPALGSHQSYKVTPLWYESGDGGLTRGTSEFARRFFLCGSRRFLKVGDQIYHPSLHGTPSAWNGRFNAVETLTATDGLNADVAIGGNPHGEWNLTGGTVVASMLDDLGTDDTDFIDDGNTVGVRCRNTWAPIISTVSGAWTLKIRIKRAGSLASGPQIQLVSGATGDPGGAGTTFFNHILSTAGGGAQTGAITTSFTTVTYALTAGEVTDLNTHKASFSSQITSTGGGSAVSISAIWLTGPGSVSTPDNNILRPSGPLSPVHAGSLSKGNAVSDDGIILILPDADDTDGAWVNSDGNGTNLYSYIDETAFTLGVDEYIKSAASGSACTVRLSDPSFTPSVNDTVEVSVTLQSEGAPNGAVLVELLEGSTVRNTPTYYYAPSSGTGVTTSVALSSTQIAAVTDWTNMKLRFSVPAGVATTRVLRAAVQISTNVVSQNQGGWKGSDRFYWSIFPKYMDGSIGAGVAARPPSTTLPNGYNLFTVDVSNPDNTYDSVLWSNLPIMGPHVDELVLARTTKISSALDDNLQISPFNMRVITTVKNGVTSYRDYAGSDDSLTPKLESQLFLRHDHIMPPAARYIFGGDMRVCHAYGRQNPGAIQIAPAGRAADYDLNLAYDSSTAYTSQGSWMQILLAANGTMTLTLIQGDGATATNTSTFNMDTTYNTLQKLVDAINATNFATNGQQWRAELCPGADPDALCTSLVPHNRVIDSCVVSGQTISVAGIGKVAVGQLIGGTGVTAGAYVSRIDSSSQITFVGTITAGTRTHYFYNDLGDSQVTTPATTTLGFQRVISGALPALLYFTKTYLTATPTEKSTVWMTVASPGQAKSAAAAFSGKASNQFTPPSRAGISMGGGAVEQGFVIPFGNQVYAIVNENNTGLDEDYRLVALNESKGCCAWNTVVPGNGFVPYLTPEGWFAADLRGEAPFSEAIWDHVTQTGDYSYEIPLCIAATASDTDAAYVSARVMRSALWVNYRAASATHPNRQTVYDFSTGQPSTGLRSLFRPDGSEWGWSPELHSALSGDRAFTAMCEGRRSDGSHLYGWNELNAGSAGDGRIDEFETGNTDNGTAITAARDSVGHAAVYFPWIQFGEDLCSIQEATFFHTAGSGMTGNLRIFRGTNSTPYDLTPSTSSTLDVIRDLKLPKVEARAAVRRYYLGYQQTDSGAPAELRQILAKFFRLRNATR